MTQEFKTSKGEFLGVLVPDVKLHFRIHWHFIVMGISLQDVDLKCRKIDRGDTKGFYSLPNDNYKIIGIQTEITDEQASTVVDKEYFQGKFQGYTDYLSNQHESFDTALESFTSLMQKLEIKPDTKTLIIQKIK